MIKTLFVLVLLYGCGKAITSSEETFFFESPIHHSGVSEEILLDTKMSLNFDLLPLNGEIKGNDKLWSGDSWRLKNGAINYRWNSPKKEGFNYQSPTRREAFTLPTEMLKKLSPSEKYDLYMGNYDYPLKNEVDHFARFGTEDWEGLCHGWAGASVNHKEPEPRIMLNPDGVEIYFGASDIKALLSYAYSKILIRDEDSLGKRCEEKGEDEDRCNEDLGALSFHVVISNKIGLRGQSVILDIDRYKEVWNHPVKSYEAKVLKSINTPKGRRIEIKTKLTYIDVIEKNSWERQRTLRSYMTVRYELELDKRGNIIDGKWLSRERPDFIWTIQRAEKFEGYLSEVMNLLK